jgi:hypothetical protein
MINAIELLRRTADACESRARTTSDRAIKAELYDMSAQWHWLSGEAAKLHDQANKIDLAKADTTALS